MPIPRINLTSDGERVDDRVLGQLVRLEVRESDDAATVASLRFNLTQRPDGEYSILDDESFRAATPLAIDLAAPGGLPMRLFDGYVTHLRPHFETVEASCYLEVLAMDAAVLLDATERAASYPDALDSDAVTEILGRYRLDGEVVETPARHDADHRLLVQRGTDWSFLRTLAERNGYCCYFEHDPDRRAAVCHFHPPRLDEEPQADLSILHADENLEWIDVQMAFTGPVRHVGAAIDPVRKRLVRGTGEASVEPLDGDRLSDQVEDGLTAAGAEEATAWLRDPDPLDAAIAARSTAETDGDGFALEARGELDPALYRGLLRSRRTVLIKGIGARVSGLYYVRALRTTVQEGHLRQAFVAERNAVGQAGEETFGQSAEEVPPR